MRLRAARPLAGAGAAIGLWWGAVAVFDIRPFFLPGPPDLVDAFRRHGVYLVEQAVITLGHTLAGFAAAVAAGLTLAALLATFGWLRESTLPLLVAVQAVPKVAIAPLLIGWLGFGHQPKIVLVALLCFFPILLSTMTGLSSTPTELVDLARSLTAPGWQVYLKIRVPWALPQVFTGLKVGGSLALIGAVVAQITTPNAGLGAVIVLSGQSADTPLAFAAIALLAAIGISVFYSLTLIEKAIVPWAAHTTG